MASRGMCPGYGGYESFPPSRYKMKMEDRQEFTVQSSVIKKKNGITYIFFTRAYPSAAINRDAVEESSEYRWIAFKAKDK